MIVSPLGDSAVVIVLGDTIHATLSSRVRAVAAEISRHPPAGVVDVVAAFASVALYFDPALTATFEALQAEIETLVARADATIVSVGVRSIEIPVCYGGEYGPDLDAVAAHTQLSVDDVVAAHTSV